jgi:hypothetical protein
MLTLDPESQLSDQTLLPTQERGSNGDNLSPGSLSPIPKIELRRAVRDERLETGSTQEEGKRAINTTQTQTSPSLDLTFVPAQSHVDYRAQFRAAVEINRLDNSPSGFVNTLRNTNVVVVPVADIRRDPIQYLQDLERSKGGINREEARAIARRLETFSGNSLTFRINENTPYYTFIHRSQFQTEPKLAVELNHEVAHVQLWEEGRYVPNQGWQGINETRATDLSLLSLGRILGALGQLALSSNNVDVTDVYRELVAEVQSEWEQRYGKKP